MISAYVKNIKIILLTVGLILLYSCKQDNGVSNLIDFNYSSLAKLAERESLIPVHPGERDTQPYWNTSAKRFINVPSFDFKNVEGAACYKFTALDSNGEQYSFVSENPNASLIEIWLNLSVGYIDLFVVGLDAEGRELIESGSRKFYKAAPFNGPYNQRVSSYTESAKHAMEYLFNRKDIQKWLTQKTPDTTFYKLYCYPAKIIGAVIEGMGTYSSLTEEKKEQALSIAKAAADYLLSISEPAGTPLEYFPPTYKGDQATAGIYKGQFMMTYPAELADNYLTLYDLTNEIKYFNAAVRIAKTYKKLQLSSGTWKLKLWQNGDQVKSILCIPIVIVKFLDRLENQYGLNDFVEASNNAFKWIMENPVKTFDWSGQFEDINPTVPYENLTEHEACSTAGYLFNHSDKDTNYILIAEELLRFSEDQFVVWEKPMPHIYTRAQRWILPCVLEQYKYYVPIDASASKLIETYLSAYKVTGKILYMAKAVELANAMTVAQIKDSGKYPTYWEYNDRRNVNEGWLNCAVYDMKVILELDKYIHQLN